MESKNSVLSPHWIQRLHCRPGRELGGEANVLEAVGHGGVGGAEGGGRVVGEGADCGRGRVGPGGWVEGTRAYLVCMSVTTLSTRAMSGLRSGSGVMQSATTALGEMALVRALTSAHSGHAGMFYVLSVYWCTSKKAETSTENTHK